jgi:hypothetical protein
MVESLPAFAAVAEQRSLPFVLSSKTTASGTSFMGKGATYRDGVFAFDLKYKSEVPVLVRVYFPKGNPAAVTVDKDPVDRSFEPDDRVVRFELPGSSDFRKIHVQLNED